MPRFLGFGWAWDAVGVTPSVLKQGQRVNVPEPCVISKLSLCLSLWCVRGSVWGRPCVWKVRGGRIMSEPAFRNWNTRNYSEINLERFNLAFPEGVSACEPWPRAEALENLLQWRLRSPAGSNGWALLLHPTFHTQLALGHCVSVAGPSCLSLSRCSGQGSPSRPCCLLLLSSSTDYRRKQPTPLRAYRLIMENTHSMGGCRREAAPLSSDRQLAKPLKVRTVFVILFDPY